jgi:hypothetical protein
MPFGGGLTIGLLGAGSGAASGKKGKNAQKAQTALAQQELGLQKQVAGQAMGNITPASNYFQALLSGDPTQIAGAVGPTSDILKQQGAASAAQLAATTPAGGQSTQAQAANSANTYNQMARLYAGVQPAAASALASLGTGELGVAAPNVGSAGKALSNNAAANNQKAGQSGALTGQALGKIQQNKNNPTPTPTVTPMNFMRGYPSQLPTGGTATPPIIPGIWPGFLS